jgi:hypothetical protein
MELTHFLKSELNYYRDIAVTECENNPEEEGWLRTRTGYQFILDGKTLDNEALRETMRGELENRADNYAGPNLREWRSLMAELGFCRRPPTPREYPMVRDLDNPAYTIPYGKNTWCGPAALAYLLRTDPDAAAACIRKITGRDRVIGTPRSAMLKALEAHGCSLAVRSAYRRGRAAPTLRRWLELVNPQADAEYLVMITHHYIVVHGSRWFDNHCHLGKTHDKSPHLRCRVRQAWKITKKSPVV